MFERIRQLHNNRNGAAAVEMAFILPIFLLFVLGMIEFGRAYWTLDSMQLAIDEAGRYAMVNVVAPDANIIGVAKASLYGLDSTQFNVTSVSTTVSGVNYKVISASYVFTFLAPGILPYSFTLTRSTTVPLMP